MTTTLGIDEAGRGPVIGPLVIAAVKIKPEQEQFLIDLGVKDSKLLSPLQRERMFDEILQLDHKILIISSKEIDDTLNSDDSNLNWLEADQSIILLESLNAENGILDCPSNNVVAYTRYITTKLKTKTKILCEHKADQKYPVVSAASILAKDRKSVV